MREPAREEGETDEEATEPVLGCERGGLQSAEQLLLARYFMFSQVYHHPTRLAYNEHLKDFLKLWLPDHVFPVDVDGHLSRDDSDVLVGIKQAAADPNHPAHDPARRIVTRDHFKVAYEKKAAPEGWRDGRRRGPRATRPPTCRLSHVLRKSASAPSSAAYGAPPSNKKPPDFAVRVRGERFKSVWASGLSDVFRRLPESPDEYVLADGEIREDVRRWLENERVQRILTEARATQIQEAEEEVT